MALFIPPAIFAVHIQFNLLYQFWIHTEVNVDILMIKHLGSMIMIMIASIIMKKADFAVGRWASKGQGLGLGGMSLVLVVCPWSWWHVAGLGGTSLVLG